MQIASCSFVVQDANLTGNNKTNRVTKLNLLDLVPRMVPQHFAKPYISMGLAFSAQVQILLSGIPAS